MPAPRPETMEFLLTRRSRPAKTLRAPGPDRVALQPILTAGLRVPDHGKLEPWQVSVLTGDALTRLAGLAADHAADPAAAEKATIMFTTAPVIVAVAATPVHSEKIPADEQLLSAGAVCLSVVNAALASGWGANWLSGWTARHPGFLREAFGLSAPAQIAGYIVIGTEGAVPPERPRPDLAAKVTYLDR